MGAKSAYCCSGNLRDVSHLDTSKTTLTPTLAPNFVVHLRVYLVGVIAVKLFVITGTSGVLALDSGPIVAHSDNVIENDPA